MPSYTRTLLETEVTAMVSGDFDATDFDTLGNRAVRQVLSDIDMRSMQRKAALAPNLFDDVYQYTCPSDLKARKIVDIQPQVNRGRLDYWRFTTEEEFDRYKANNLTDMYGDPIVLSKHSSWLGENLVAISDSDFVRKLLLSRPSNDTPITISPLNSVGDWEAFGDGENLTADSNNYVTGSASINWDIDDAGGTTAGIQNTSLTDFDVSNYKTDGYIFVWAYISSITNLTNYIIRVGSDTSNYYSITITTNNEGNAFYNGWNLLRFSFSGKATTGTPDDDACDYVALYMTKDGAKVSETDYRFDNIVMGTGSHYSVIYYSRFGWISAAGSRLENATADTDLLMVDTDEFDMICLKTAELIERGLGNQDEAMIHKGDYEMQKETYVFNNPSRAMELTQTYYDL